MGIMMGNNKQAASIREYCLSKHRAYEDRPFGETPICFKLNGKIFAQLYPYAHDYKITLKCTLMQGDFYRQLYPGVVVRGYHCPPVQQPYWNTVYLENFPEDELRHMIDSAYDVVFDSFSKKVQKSLLSTPQQAAEADKAGADAIAGAKWLFFDLGSTLVDEEKAYNHRIRDMIAGTDLTFEEVHQKREALARQGLDGNSAVIAYYGLTKTPWHGEDEKLYADAKAVLQHLVNRGYKLAILANQNPGVAKRLASWGIERYFDVIASSAELGVAKPDPAIFKTALGMAGCEASQAVMIGDRLDNDIIPAKKLGMQTLWLRNGLAASQPRELGAGYADFIIDSLSEITRLFS